MKKLKADPKVIAAMIAISALNFNMKQAAKNPMDKFRRENVQKAFLAVPPTLMALAQTFKNGEMHDKDLPMLQQLLGGFVDTSFADKMKSFAANPSEKNIPSLGKDFPKEYQLSGDKSHIMMDDTRGLGQSSIDSINSKDPSSPNSNQDLMDLNQIKLKPKPAVKKSSINDEMQSEIAKELDEIESGLAKKKSLKKKGFKGFNESFFIYPIWHQHPLWKWASIFYSNPALAKGGSCGDCGEGASGADAGKSLEMMAVLMMGLAPAIAAMAQANADKEIARSNAQSQLRMTEMQANIAREQGENQKNLAIFQANLTKQIADDNNKASSEKLQIQLAELKAARDQARESELEKRKIDLEFQVERIKLARRQADDNLKVGEQTLSAQIMQAGLTTGFKTTQDPSNRLGVERVFGTNNQQVATTSSFGTAFGNSGTAALGAGTNGQIPNFTGAGEPAQIPTGSVGFVKQPTPTGARALLLSSTSAGSELLPERDPMTGSFKLKNPLNPIAKGFTSTNATQSSSKKSIQNRGIATIAKGSTRGFKQKSFDNESEQSETQLLLADLKADPDNFVAYEAQRRQGSDGGIHKKESQRGMVRTYFGSGDTGISSLRRGSAGRGLANIR